MENRWLHRAAVLLAACTLFLLIAGACVTSDVEPASDETSAQVAQQHPPSEAAMLESVHSISGAAVGLLTAGMVIWLSFVEKRRWLRRLTWTTLAVMIVELLLGSRMGIGALSPALGVFHALLAQLFFSATVAIALFTSSGWNRGPELVEDRGWPSMRSLAITTPVLVLLQVMLGAAYRHREMGLMSHIIGAIIVLLFILIVTICVMQQFPTHRPLRFAAATLMTFTFIQVMLGFGALFARMLVEGVTIPVIATTAAHVANGALTLAASVVLAIQIRRNVQAAAEEQEGTTAVIS